VLEVTLFILVVMLGILALALVAKAVVALIDIMMEETE
jgi:hypothetical protein